MADQAICLLHYNMASRLPKVCFSNTDRATIIRPAAGILVVGLLFTVRGYSRCSLLTLLVLFIC